MPCFRLTYRTDEKPEDAMYHLRVAVQVIKDAGGSILWSHLEARTLLYKVQDGANPIDTEQDFSMFELEETDAE